jgi:hypothetical protein
MRAVMLDRAKNAWTLLGLLTAFTVGFLALVIVATPFRGTEGPPGWAAGDKSQAVAQLMLLVEFAMAALCLSFGGDLPALAEGVVILVCLGAVVFPIVYMKMLGKVADETDDDKFKFANPLHDVDDGSPVVVAKPVAAKKASKKKGGKK